MDVWVRRGLMGGSCVTSVHRGLFLATVSVSDISG